MILALSLVRVLRQATDRLVPGGNGGLSTPNRKSILDVVAGTLYRMSGGRLPVYLEKSHIGQIFPNFTSHTLVARVQDPPDALLAGSGR